MTFNYKTYINEIKNISQKGLFHLFSVNGLIFLVGFASQLFVAGILSPADIGRIKIMQTYIGLASLIGGFGFNTSLLKLASDDRFSFEKEDLLNLSIVVAFFSFFLIYTILLVLLTAGFISNDKEIINTFPFYSLFLLPLIIQSMQLSYYQAIKKIKKMAYIQFAVKFLSVSLIIGATYLYNLFGYVLIIPITGLLSITVLGIGLPNFYKNIFPIKLQLNKLGLMWSLAKFALLANLVGTLLATLDIYLINYFVTDKTQVGYYMFAVTIVSIYRIIPSSIQQVAFPFFSQKSINYHSWKKAYKKYNLLNYFVIIIVGLIGIILIPEVIPYLFKGKYDNSIGFFVFLTLAWGLSSLNMMKGTALMGFGKFNLNFYSSLISLIISAPLMYYFVVKFGLNGAVGGRIFSGIVLFISSYITFYFFIRKLTVTNEI